jgi:hypothetical protein
MSGVGFPAPSLVTISLNFRLQAVSASPIARGLRSAA